ncbi:hypothetical protein [Pseudomonas sp. PDM27]|uniref:hypothetical protein n=1 Tax=Pseudomonas sp. PDM27 TaxID=2854769 RepID=UPI001C45E35B|nr:hypothetical protein [Pseudomonas sp. PDM27]MBV7566587.1 hypothetical protein [Pseudomonas sp. PDM27]
MTRRSACSATADITASIEGQLLARKLPIIKGCYRTGAVGEQNNCKLVAMLCLLSKLIRQSGRLRGNDPQRALCHPIILREASSSGAQIRNNTREDME